MRLRIAVLAKQVPALDELQLGPDTRLQRGAGGEIDPLSRRAIAQGVALARATGGSCSVVSMGPECADQVLREALAWGATAGVLISDRRLRGADATATAAVLAAVLRRRGPFDLVLAGRASVDGETATVGAQVAQRLDLPFVAAVRRLTPCGDGMEVWCEHDDEIVHLKVRLPAVLTVAERLCDPAKVAGEAWEPSTSPRISRLRLDDLDLGGCAPSHTSVRAVRTRSIARQRQILSGPIHEQIDNAVGILVDLDALGHHDTITGQVAPSRPLEGPETVVLVAGDRLHQGRALLGEAAQIASETAGHVTALVPGQAKTAELAAWGADRIAVLTGSCVAEDVASACGELFRRRPPWAVLGSSAPFPLEVLSRLAVRLETGIICDATGLHVEGGTLVGHKPGLGGSVVAEIQSTHPPYLVTLRPGALALRAARQATQHPAVSHQTSRRSTTVTLDRNLCDDWDALDRAQCVVGVGLGVREQDYPKLRPLLDTIGAELAATRKVTDARWQPRSRQIGITGRFIAPALYIAVGLSGKSTHSAGIQSAGTILAINTDHSAPIFENCDIGIVADWRTAVPLLADALRRVQRPVSRAQQGQEVKVLMNHSHSRSGR